MAVGVLLGVVYILTSLYQPANSRVRLMLYIGIVALAAGLILFGLAGVKVRGSKK
jgi:uncharacterized membrane protein HdeD (DUF308 family)